MPASVTGTDLPLEAAYAAFLARYPGYADTVLLDRLRSTQYSALDRLGQVYLDSTGGALYAQSQLDEHQALLGAGVYGNPHSSNPASQASTQLLEECRRTVLRFFNAPAEEYTVVFTLNASGALKLAGESFPFAPGGRLLLTFDNHNSVNGIREFAHAHGATITYAPLVTPTLRLDTERLNALLAEADPKTENLFAFPAQSNFSGVKHPLSLVAQAQAQGWRVLLDAAAFVPTNRLNLSEVQPDFVSVSFYKMFGYPTGVGALIVRKDALAALRRPWFAGGTVNFASVQAQAHVLSSGEAGFEDGTLNYLAIPAVAIGIRHLESIGMDRITERVRCLTGWMLEELLELRHANGRALVRIYGPANNRERGGTVAFNLYDPQGHLLDYRRIEELAGAEGISLRTGCFCNPGAGEAAEGLTEDDMKAALTLGADINLAAFVRFMRDRGHKSAGAIRVSLGLVSDFADVWRFLGFVAGFRDQVRDSLGDVTFDIDSCRIIRDGS